MRLHARPYLVVYTADPAACWTSALLLLTVCNDLGPSGAGGPYCCHFLSLCEPIKKAAFKHEAFLKEWEEEVGGVLDCV